MVRRTVVLLAVLPAPLLVATSCGSASGRDSEADRRRPPPGDTCHDLAAADLEQPSDPRPAVPCRGRHTTQTFAVGALPRDTGRTYDFGHTWFHEATWTTGIRRSVCWARTDR